MLSVFFIMNLDIRTKKTVEESIQSVECYNKDFPQMIDTTIRYVCYAPGNGTQYRLVFTDISSLHLDEMNLSGGWLVTCLNSMKSMMVANSKSMLHYSYAQEKLGVGISDAVCLAEIIAHFTGRTAVSCEEMNDL
jgi:hypothetical protein